MQQTFQTGERVSISTKNSRISPLDPYRTIIRGGSHLEPILYTQYGQLPNVTFNTTMSFEDIVLAPGGNVGNYTALYANYITFPDPPPQQMYNWNDIEQVAFETTVYGIPSSYLPLDLVLGAYPIPANAITDGISLTVTVTGELYLENFYGSHGDFSYTYYFKKKDPVSLNTEIIFTSEPDVFTVPPGEQGIAMYPITPPTVTLPAGTFNSGDQISFWIGGNMADFNILYLLPSTLFFTVSQYPISTQPITSSGANSIWGYGNKTTHPYIITSSNPTLVQLYGDPNAKAKDISGSGFNPIQLPWKINYGDEFKFEGREDWSYMVKNIYAPAESGSGRIFQTGSIEVHFNANLPVSASSSVFNLDHFLIRRYVDDAAQNIITGFRPPGSEGPYLVKPEFVVPELNKSIDEVILDLTQKGLIT
jgi:hypothetical protein